jgi:hypothetical protein
MPLNATLKHFGDLLDLRLKREVFTTEDAVRYTFFAALLAKGGLYAHDVVLEHRHPSIAGAEIDTWAPTFGGKGLAVEFKYDRALPGGKNTPRTQRAGHVFHDLYRLRMVPGEMQRVFVYLTGPEMAKYFSNPVNGLSGFFTLHAGHTLLIDADFMRTKAPSFVAACQETPDVQVSQLHSRSLPLEHQLRIYEVLGAPVTKRVLSPAS